MPMSSLTARAGFLGRDRSFPAKASSRRRCRRRIGCADSGRRMSIAVTDPVRGTARSHHQSAPPPPAPGVIWGMRAGQRPHERRLPQPEDLHTRVSAWTADTSTPCRASTRSPVSSLTENDTGIQHQSRQDSQVRTDSDNDDADHAREGDRIPGTGAQPRQRGGACGPPRPRTTLEAARSSATRDRRHKGTRKRSQSRGGAV